MTSIMVNADTHAAMDTTNKIRPQDSRSPSPEVQDESLLDMEEAEAAKQMLKEWDDSWKPLKGIKEVWRANKARAEGYTGVQLVKRQDHAEARIPVGTKKSVAGLNKALRLTRRIRAFLFGDPPMPEATPARDEDEARDASETATRILQDQCSEGQLSFTLAAGDAFDLGGIYGSGFIRFWVDPQGGGWVPKQIEASPNAVSPDDPMVNDPAAEPILRYVTEDGQFTEQRAEAGRRWLPSLRREILTGKNVRFIPFQVRDIWEVDGMMVGTVKTLREVKLIIPEIAQWPPDRIQKLVSFRPQHFNELLGSQQKDQTATNQATDDAYCFVLTRYHKQSSKYPEGAYLIAAGESEMLYRDKWFDETHAEVLDIPITQFKQLSDTTKEHNPYGTGMLELLGPGNEIRAAMIGSMLEHLDRFTNRKLFVPMTSPLQPQQLQSPTGTPIPILPGGEPKYEEIPDFPTIVEKMLQFADHDMDDESGLQQSGQAMQSPSVQSAKHFQANLEQVGVLLSDLKENTARALIRGWRIMLQLDRAFFTDAQQLSWIGEDGRFKTKRWQATDLGDTKQVRIQRGTFTQLTPQAKALTAQQYQQLGLLGKPEFEHVIEGSVGGLFGLQDNPHRLRVRRQIADWQEGPPKQMPPQPPLMGGMPSVPAGNAGASVAAGAPVSSPGQPPQPPPNPFAQVLSQIFDQRPVDNQPDVAAIRLYELGRAMAGTYFTRWPPEWRQGLFAAYQQAYQAAQVPDAKQMQQMQKQLQDANQKLAKPNLSFSVKLADMDAQQTAVILQQEGIQVPPAGPKAPEPAGPDPQQQVALELEKHRISEEAGIVKERVKATAKAQADVAVAQHTAALAERLHQAVQPRGMKVLRDERGKVIGTTPA
jgi:hypothetical protein